MANSSDLFLSLIQGFNAKPSYQPQAMNFDNFNPTAVGQGFLGAVNKGLKDYNTNELLGQYMANADEGTLMQLAQTNPEVANFLLEKRKLDAQLAPKPISAVDQSLIDYRKAKLQQNGQGVTTPEKQAFNARFQQLIGEGMDENSAYVRAFNEMKPGNIGYDAMGNMIQGQAPFGSSVGGQPSKQQAAYQGTGLPRVTADNVDEFREKYIAQVETGGIKDRDNAVSPKGAVGYNQIMPETYREFAMNDPLLKDKYDWKNATPEALAENLKDRKINNYVANGLLAKYAQKYGGDPEKVAAAYNAGPGAVDKYNGVPRYRETQNYIRKMGGIASGGSPFEQKEAISSFYRQEEDKAKVLTAEDRARANLAVKKKEQISSDALTADQEAAFYDELLQPLQKGQFKQGFIPEWTNLVNERLTTAQAGSPEQEIYTSVLKNIEQAGSLEVRALLNKVGGQSFSDNDLKFTLKAAPNANEPSSKILQKTAILQTGALLRQEKLIAADEWEQQYGNLAKKNKKGESFDQAFNKQANQRYWKNPIYWASKGVSPKPFKKTKDVGEQARMRAIMEAAPIGTPIFFEDENGNVFKKIKGQ